MRVEGELAIINGETPGGAKVTNTTPDAGDYALAVRLVGGGSSNTQYTEDAPAAADPVGTAVNLIRKDTPASITGTDGDNVAQRGTNYGAGYVQVVTSAGAFVDTFGGGTQYTEGDTDASITGTAMLMEGAANTLLTVPGTTADGLLVNLGGNNDVTVTSGAITETNSAAIAASLSVLDDWDETDRAKVNVIAGQVGIAAGSGANGVTVPRVTIATDDPVSTFAASKYITGIATGRTTVTTAGTRVVLAGSTACKKVIITAETDNTGLMVVGGTGVVAALATRQGTPLSPGDSVEFDIDNLNDVNIDSMVSTDGVTYTYFV